MLHICILCAETVGFRGRTSYPKLNKIESSTCKMTFIASIRRLKESAESAKTWHIAAQYNVFCTLQKIIRDTFQCKIFLCVPPDYDVKMLQSDYWLWLLAVKHVSIVGTRVQKQDCCNVVIVKQCWSILFWTNQQKFYLLNKTSNSCVALRPS